MRLEPHLRRYAPTDRHPIGRFEIVLLVARAIEPDELHAVCALQADDRDVAGVCDLDVAQRRPMPIAAQPIPRADARMSDTDAFDGLGGLGKDDVCARCGRFAPSAQYDRDLADSQRRVGGWASFESVDSELLGAICGPCQRELDWSNDEWLAWFARRGGDQESPPSA